jgi:hypothetical protein
MNPFGPQLCVAGIEKLCLNKILVEIKVIYDGACPPDEWSAYIRFRYTIVGNKSRNIGRGR